jgi:hypothetical protein
MPPHCRTAEPNFGSDQKPDQECDHTVPNQEYADPASGQGYDYEASGQSAAVARDPIPVEIHTNSQVLTAFWDGLFSPMSAADFRDSILEGMARKVF